VAQISNKLRAFTPWPGIYMMHEGKRLKILDIEKLSELKEVDAGKLIADGNKLLLGTKLGVLSIKKLQPEGKKPLTEKEFINGFLS
jgi:methionyl-tRNA formyltransferase